jgi:hypothetical protein
VLADAQLGPELWEFCAEQAGEKDSPPIIVLTYDPQDIAQARVVSATTCLQLPLPMVDIVACVDQLTSRSGTVDVARMVNNV